MLDPPQKIQIAGQLTLSAHEGRSLLLEQDPSKLEISDKFLKTR